MAELQKEVVVHGIKEWTAFLYSRKQLAGSYQIQSYLHRNFRNISISGIDL